MRAWPAAGLLIVALGIAPGAAQAQPPPQATFEVGMVTARETDPDVRVGVKLPEPQDEVVRIDWAAGPPYMIADTASALEGRDYTGGRGTLEFAPGDMRREIVLPLLDNGIYDGGRMLALTLGPGGPFGGPFAIVDIRDDEAPPPVSIADVAVPESAGAAKLRVVRPWPSSFAERYGWSTAAGTAAIGADFVARTGEVGMFSQATVPPEIEVPIENDTIDEPDETFEVRLATLPPPSPWGFGPGVIGDGVATVTIVDDDPRGAAPALTARGVRGRVVVRQPGGARRRLSGDLVLRRGTLVDARRGAVRLRLGDREATLAGGIVKVRDLARVALAGPCRRRLAVAADPGLVVAGRRASTSAAGGRARWIVADCRATRVTVRKGRVSAVARGGRADELRAGERRTYR